MNVHRLGELDTTEDPVFERRQWRMERIAWTLLGVVVLLALTGLLGAGGPLSTTHAVSADGSLRVEYPRFARRQAESDITLHVAVPGDGPLRITLDRARSVVGAGADSLAVISDLYATGDITGRVRAYLEVIR